MSWFNPFKKALTKSIKQQETFEEQKDQRMAEDTAIFCQQILNAVNKVGLPRSVDEELVVIITAKAFATTEFGDTVSLSVVAENLRGKSISTIVDAARRIKANPKATCNN